MTYTRTWDASAEASPGATDLVSGGDDAIRNLKTDIRERIAKDHYMDIAGTDADHGEHSKVTFQAPIAKPANIANKGFMYIKDVSAKAELHFEDEDGNEVQLTSAGGLNTALITTLLNNLKASIYPVGSIYIEITGVNPGTTFGFGTWVAFGAGRVPVGLDSSQTEFDSVEETGGAKTVVGGTHTVAIPGDSSWPHTSISGNGQLAVGRGHSEYVDYLTSNRTLTTSSPAATSVLQPYIVVYMWKRTA